MSAIAIVVAVPVTSVFRSLGPPEWAVGGIFVVVLLFLVGVAASRTWTGVAFKDAADGKPARQLNVISVRRT